MARPHYVAQKVGGEYKMVRVDETANPLSLNVPSLLAGGVALAVLALLVRGPIRWLAGGVATGLFAYWFVGDQTGGRKLAHPAHGPSFPRDTQAPHAATNQPPADAIDEASMESFPASDPPAHMTPTHAL